MPRHAKGPRLYLRKRRGRPAVYVIRDGSDEHSTGCGADDLAGARRALEAHLAAAHRPPQRAADDLARILIADVINAYLTEHAPTAARADFLTYTAGSALRWWGTKTLADVRAQACRDYVAWRTAETAHRHPNSKKPPRQVSVATARHDLKTLRAAIEHYHAEHGPLPSVPVVTMPDPPAPRDRWYARDEAARLIRALRRSRRSRHLIRLVLIGLYTGTRSGAMKRLRWLPSVDGGWIDLERGVMHRRGSGERKSRKRQPPVRLGDRLLAHLRRWHRMDQGEGARYGAKRRRPRASTYVVHHYGRPIDNVRKAYTAAAAIAGVAGTGPHTLRHTAATWLMQAGVAHAEAAALLGMSIQTLEDVYGHHHPDFQHAAANAVALAPRKRPGNERQKPSIAVIGKRQTP